MLRMLLPLLVILFTSSSPQTEIWRSVVQVGQLITLPREGKQAILMRGSGTIVTGHGLVLTNYHVAKKDYAVAKRAFGEERLFIIADELVIAIPSGINQPAKPRYAAVLVEYDQELDVAILRIHRPLDRTKAMPSRFPALPIGSSSSIRVGQSIVAYGYPVVRGGLLTRFEGRFMGWYQDTSRPFMRIDAELSPGFSGGTATTTEGIFIGIPTKVHLIVSSEPCLFCNRTQKVYLLRPAWDAKEMIPIAK